MTRRTQPVIHDTLVIGGGPAGLAAAIYLGRALRSVIVFDQAAPGRSDWVQHNHNYLGFPEGIAIRDLGQRGREQAERFGARFINERVTSIEQEAEFLFKVRANRRVYRGRTVIIATGVSDRWCEFPGSETHIGRSMHWCIVCDGYEMQGQRVLVVGNDEVAAEDARQLLRFTPDVALLIEPGEHELSSRRLRTLKQEGVAIHTGRIAGTECREPGWCTSVVTDTGEQIPVDHIFSVLGAVPNTEVAAGLDLALDEDGYIRTDTEARTSVPGVYAAGDVTRLFSHQVVTAAHEGATAAMAIAWDLWQREIA